MESCTAMKTEITDQVTLDEEETCLLPRLGVCELCCLEEAKYRCPCCGVKSCSLPCVRQHKLDTGCSGIRNRTLYKPLSQFTELDLLSGEHWSSHIFLPGWNSFCFSHRLPTHGGSSPLCWCLQPWPNQKAHTIPQRVTSRNNNNSHNIHP